MASSAALYTPEVLALATSLADHPLTDDLLLIGTARSPACGSTLTLGFALDAAGRIARVGLRAQACAIGQAAAAIFAQGAPGTDATQIAASVTALERWLGGEGPLPHWPGLEAIAAAQAFPGRHGAMLLPWRAALSALSSAAVSG